MLNCRQGLKGHLVAGDSNDTPPMAVFLPHDIDTSGLASASEAQNELVRRIFIIVASPVSISCLGPVSHALTCTWADKIPQPPRASYAMVRIQMSRTAGREDARSGEATEGLDGKICNPERWA